MRLCALVILAATVGAQTPTYPHLVVTAFPGGSPAAQVLEVDTANSTVTPLGRFPADALPPLAIALDPFDRQVLLALDLGGNRSRLVRLERTPTGLVEYAMFDVAGQVTGIAVNGDHVVLSSDGGQGVWQAPRRGGTATLSFAHDNLKAIQGYGPTSSPALVAWTGRAGTSQPNSGTAVVDSLTGQIYLGPDSFPNPSGLELTCAVDLATGVPRQLLAFANGTFALFTPAVGAPQSIVPSVPIPVGGAVAMQPSTTTGGSPMVLGGAALARLYEVDPFTGLVTFRSPVLPGAPVAFCAGGTRAAQGLQLADRCGAIAMFQGWSGLEQPGNTFSLTIQGQSNGYAVLVVGLRDNPVVPIVMPGGCLLHVTPDATQFHLLDGAGNASQAIAVPPGQAFLGLMLFCQWLVDGPTGISSSSTVVHQIGL